MWPSRQAELGWIDVMRRPAKNGFASCYCTRFKWALDSGYKVITEMDADLSHDAHVLLRLLSALDEGAGVAVGPRYVPGGIKANWSLGCRALSRPATGTRAGASGAASLTSAQPSACTAEMLRSVDFATLHAEGYRFLIELAYSLERLRARFAGVSVQFINRVEGRSKLSPATLLGGAAANKELAGDSEVAEAAGLVSQVVLQDVEGTAAGRAAPPGGGPGPGGVAL